MKLLGPHESTDIMGLDKVGNKVAVGLIVGGSLALITGVIMFFRQRQGGLGRAQVVEPPTQRGGMTLTHYRSKHMPIEERVKILQDLTWEDVHDPRNRKLALGITKHCPDRDDMCETRAVYDAVHKNIRYTGDVAPLAMGHGGPVEGVDLFQSAYRTWEFGGGDCDDQSRLVATLLTLNGIPAKFRTTASKKNEDFSHIYTLAGIPKMYPTKWIAVDTTLPGERFGYEAPYVRKQDFAA